MYKVIMAPTEGSDSENLAISVAVKLAQRFNAELRLVRVEAAPLVIESVPRPPVLQITEDTLRAERLARLRKLESLGVQCRALGDIRVITALEEGPVAPALREYAEKYHVDLIVMSSHARGGVRRITLGSVTDNLIRHSTTPVLVVKPPATFVAAAFEETVPRIVVPLDGSRLAEQILPEVAAIAGRLNATVSLLQVLTPGTYSQKEIMQPGLPWWDEDIAAAEAYLERASSFIMEEGVSAGREVILASEVAPAILEYAKTVRADLIALAANGSGGTSRFVFGAVTDEVMRRSPVSVLVLHPRQAATRTSGLSETRALAVPDVA